MNNENELENFYMKQKLAIYEKRFCIIGDVVHSLLVEKFPVAIGFLEHAYFVHKNNKKCICRKIKKYST